MSPGLPRVLVLTGTSDHPFRRLLDALPALLRGGVAREVRVQSRFPAPSMDGIVHLGMLSRDDIRAELAGADVVICHGGSGSCFDAIRAGHRPIVVPRRAALGEHVDDHQLDLAEAISARSLAIHLVDATEQALAREVRACPPRVAPERASARVIGQGLRAMAETLGVRVGVSHAPTLRIRSVPESVYASHTSSFPLASPLQSVAWGDARRLDGWTPRWWIATDGRGRALAGAQTLRKRIPAPYYLPYGPSVARGPEGIRAARALLQAVARNSAAGVLWAPSWFHAEPDLSDPLRARSLGPSSMTGTLDLSVPEADLREVLRGTWRRDLEKAERDPSITARIEDPRAIVRGLLREVAAMAERRGFHAPVTESVAARFAEEAVGRRCPELIASVAVAGGAPLATYVVAVAGDVAQTLWTAGSDDVRAGGAGRLALWAALGRARQLGALTYDLAGIDDAGNPGVASFKRGLRPTILEVPGMRWIPPGWAPPALVEVLEPVIRRFVASASK